MQRGIVIHGTHESTVARNVVYDVRGASLYIEDGNEFDNRLLHNVAVCPWPRAEGHERAPSEAARRPALITARRTRRTTKQGCGRCLLAITSWATALPTTSTACSYKQTLTAATAEGTPRASSVPRPSALDVSRATHVTATAASALTSWDLSSRAAWMRAWPARAMCVTGARVTASRPMGPTEASVARSPTMSTTTWSLWGSTVRCQAKRGRGERPSVQSGGAREAAVCVALSTRQTPASDRRGRSPVPPPHEPRQPQPHLLEDVEELCRRLLGTSLGRQVPRQGWRWLAARSARPSSLHPPRGAARGAGEPPPLTTPDLATQAHPPPRVFPRLVYSPAPFPTCVAPLDS